MTIPLPPFPTLRAMFAPLRVCVAVMLCAGMPAMGAAQAEPSSSGAYVLERRVLDRWVHEAQHPAFVPFEITDNAFQFRIGEPVGSARMRTVTVQRDRMALDARNRILSVTVEPPLAHVGRHETLREQAENRRRGVRGQGALLSLPTARLWEVPFTLPALPLGLGIAWADTLSFHATAEGMWERLEGVWHHHVAGDTVVDGRTLPLVVTTADIRYTARELTSDAAMDTLLEVLRDVAGRMHGRAAVDTTVGVRAAGSDSTRLTGTATLRMGDGAPLVSGVQYDRRRTWLLRDSVEWAASRDSAAAELRRLNTGMLRVPRNAVEERLRAGETAVTDSLLRQWMDTTDPDERQRILSVLAYTSARSSVGLRWDRQLRELRMEAGDPAAIVEQMLDDGSGRAELAPLLLDYLDDPVRLWRAGVLPRWPYVQLANRLMAATPLLEPDVTRWPCAPGNCDAFIAVADTATEPRLRDAALAGAFARDPARWWDRIVARADSGSAIAARARQLGEGVGATWPAAPKSPVPAPGADWRSWLDWMGGTHRFGRSHAEALQVYTARTGRDPTEELLRTWPPAGDSAQLVIGTILRELGTLPARASAELTTAVLYGSPAARDDARREIVARLHADGRPAADTLMVALLRPLLDAIAGDGILPWLDHEGQPVNSRRMAGRFHGVLDVPVFVVTDNLPEALTDALPPDFIPITREAWDARPLREGGVLINASPVREWDGFVTVRIDWGAYQRRAADEAPAGYAGGGSFTLVRTGDQWRIISDASWIT